MTQGMTTSPRRRRRPPNFRFRISAQGTPMQQLDDLRPERVLERVLDREPEVRVLQRRPFPFVLTSDRGRHEDVDSCARGRASPGPGTGPKREGESSAACATTAHFPPRLLGLSRRGPDDDRLAEERGVVLLGHLEERDRAARAASSDAAECAPAGWAAVSSFAGRSRAAKALRGRLVGGTCASTKSLAQDLVALDLRVVCRADAAPLLVAGLRVREAHVDGHEERDRR